MTTRTFIVEVTVAAEFMESDREMARALAHSLLKDKASETLRGPRGGGYLPVSEPYDFRGGQNAHDWHLNQWSFVARVDAKYVRPGRLA